MMNADAICFGLLAGGQSRRMGVDKASLIWRGQPLWQHQLRLAAEIGAKEILISGRPDGSYHNAARVVADEYPERGPMEGLASLLAAMTNEWLVVVAVDMPLLNAEALQHLLGSRDWLRDGDQGVVPMVGGQIEPLAAVYSRDTRRLARHHADSKERSVLRFARAAAAAGYVRIVNLGAHADWVRSVNTPEEWAEASRLAGQAKN